MHSIDGIYSTLHVQTTKDSQANYGSGHTNVPLHVVSLLDNCFASIDEVTEQDIVTYWRIDGSLIIGSDDMYINSYDSSKTDYSVLPYNRQSINPRHHDIFKNSYDICAISNAADHLLVLATKAGLMAYSMKRKTFIWIVSGHLPGMDHSPHISSVCSDDADHVYAVDSNNSNVHMFTKEGIYVSTVVKEGDFGIGKPVMVSWLKDGKILVVLHEIVSGGRKKFMVSGIKLPV